MAAPAWLAASIRHLTQGGSPLGSRMTKTGGSSDTQNGNARTEPLLPGVGSIEFSLDAAQAAWVGLTLAATPDDLALFGAFNFGLYVDGTATVTIREGTAYKTDFAQPVAQRNTFKVAVEDVSGVLRVAWYLNGVFQYRHVASVPYPGNLAFGLALLTVNGYVDTIVTEGFNAVAPPEEPPPGLSTDSQLTFTAITDRVVRNTPTAIELAALLGPAGSSYIDPAFGCRVRRITDENTDNGASWMTGAPSQCLWAPDSAAFIVRNIGGSMRSYTMDRVTGESTFQNNNLGGLEPAWAKVLSKSRIAYGMPGIASHDIRAYNVMANGGSSSVLDMKTVDPSLTGDVYTSSLYSSAALNGIPERIIWGGGGTQQDKHMKVCVFDVDTPTNRWFLDMSTGLINGVQALDEAGNPSDIATYVDPLLSLEQRKPGVFHSLAIDLSGRYGRIDPVNTSRYYWQWDLTTNRITKVTVATGGHYFMGNGRVINEDTGPDGGTKYQLLARSAATPNGTVTQLINPSQGQARPIADHQSWHNGNNPNAPIFASIYRYKEADNIQHPRLAFDDEIIGIETNLTTFQVWRFCHHNTVVDRDPDGNYYGYWYTPRVQVSPDARWAMFTSNMQKLLGAEPAVQQYEAYRKDVFLVRTQQEGAPEPPPPPPSGGVRWPESLLLEQMPMRSRARKRGPVREGC